MLAKAGVLIAASDLFGLTGRQRLARVPLGSTYAERVRSLLELIDILDGHQARFSAMIAERLRAHRGYQVIQQLPGIGPVLAAVLVAEIGDVHRFAGPAHLCSWAGLTPTHRESDTVVRRGHITNRAANSCDGRPWRPSSASRTPPRLPLIANGSRPAAAAPSPRSPRPASCSPSSTTDCATDTSARWPVRPRRDISDATRARPLTCLTPGSALSKPWISAWSPL